MEELSAKWQDLTDIQQASITELIAGKRQGNIVSSLMTNFDIAQNALQTSLGSSGSALEEHSKAMDSIELKLNSLRAAWQSFAQSFMDSNFLKKGIDALKGLVEVLEWLIDNFGLLGTIGLGTGITGFFKHFNGAKEAKKTLNDVVNAIDKIGDAVSSTAESASNMTNAVTEAADATTNVASAATEAGEATANLASTATEAAESTANMASAVSESVEATTNLASASTEAAEAGANVASVVTEGAEAAANAASATTESAEAMANLTSIVTEASEAFANMLSTITETTEAMANMASTASETAEAGANVVSTVTEVAEASANASSAGTEVVEAGANVVSTVAAVGENAVKSSKGLGKFAGGLGKTAVSAAKWVGIAGLVVAGLSLIYNQYKKNKEAAAEARQVIIEDSNTYLDAASNFEQAYIKYSGRTDLTVSEEAELEEAIKGTTNALKDKSSALHGVVNSSNDYIASLERIADAELNAAAEAAEAKKKEAGAALIESAIGWERFDGSEVNIEVGRSMTSDLSLTDKEVKIAKEIGEEYYKLDSYGKDLQGTIYSLTLDSNAGVNEIIDYYYTLLDYQAKLKEGLTEEELANSSVYEDVSSVIGKLSESIEVYTSGAYEAAKAQYQLANGIPKTTEAYLAMREAILGSEDIKGLSLDTKMSILNSLDSDYSKVFDLSSVEAQARKFVGIIENFGDGTKDGINEIGAVETFLNMRTAVNNNECTVGEYLSEFDNITSIAKKFSDEEREQFNLAFGLDTDAIKEQYEHVYNYISRQDIDWFDGYEFTPEFRLEKDNIKEQEIRKFLDDLSASELSALVGIKAEIDWENTSIEDIRKQIEKEAKIIDALNFKPNIEIDTTALETLNTALEESASAMGLTTESIDSLKAKYSDLESYDPDTLFEKTANGVKVNREEVEKLEKEYNDLNKSKVKEHIDNLTQAYNENAKKIDECTNASERAQLISENETYRNKIEELAQYQAQLEGVTGAYQDWIDAQSGPEDYEGYESVATSREDIEDEISRGFIGNKARAYIDLLSGKDLDGKSIDDYADAWEKLDDKVTSTGYSVMDFFTINDDGDITATGIDRFMKSVKKDIEGLYDSDTGAYKFTKENIEAIQKEYEIGAEAIELLLEAAAAAGYEIDWGGILDDIDLDTSSFESLVSAAEAAQTAYNKIDGLEDVHFNFTATGVEEAESEIERARQAFSKFINEDGTVNLKADGAEEMQFILTTLIIQKQQLSTPAIMKVDTSQIDQAETDIIGAINAAQTLQSAYENYEIAISTGVDVEKAKSDLNTAIDGMKGTSVDVRADLKLPTDADLEAAKSSIGDIKVGATLDGTAVGNLATQIQTQCTPEIIAKVTGIDESAITNGEGGRQVKYTPEHSAVDNYINSLQDINKKIIFKYTTEGKKPNPSNIECTITYTYQTSGTKPSGTGPAAGTAHSNGTTGRAFARGDWGIKGNGVALAGELGPEIVVRQGKFFTVGDKGAEFFRYKPHDIVFNAAQTESLFKYGGIKGAKPRGKMLASGTAFADGNAFAWSATATESNFASNRNSSTGKSYGSKSSSSSSKSSSDSAKDDFEETFDWIEIAIDRVERAIDQLDTKANSVYRSWSERNSNLTSEISKVSSEIDLQQRAYQEYMNAANGVGLSSSWQAKIKNGAIDISTVKDEALAEKIKDFQTYYQAALDCKDAILELKETEAELYAQRFENLQTQYDGILQGYEHTETMLNEYISQAEEQGFMVSKKYYDALITNEKQNINALKQEQAELIAARDEAVASGKIAKYSEEWYSMCAEIDSVTQSIEEGSTAILEYARAIKEIDWSVFDLIQERISGITEESDFLIELLSNKKLFDDNGNLTSQGSATVALHAQNANSYMYQADTYGEEIAKLDKQIQSDPYDQDLINRRNELLELQRESILAAEQEKEAIKDLVSEGIDTQLDALQELIDKKNEQLQSEKDLYEYQKKVAEQSKEVASLEKQLAAYSGDDSEEAKQKIQQIKVDLESARQDLQETEMDKVLDDTSAMLDNLFLEAEELLNTRIDDVNAVLESAIENANANATSIQETLTSETDKVGITLSNAMNSIWSGADGSAKSVLTMYGEDFRTKSATIITTLNGIKSSVNSMVSSLNKEATTKTAANKTTTSAKKNPTTSSSSTTNKKTTTTKKSSSGDGKPKIGDRVKYVSGQYYYDSQGREPLGSKNKGEYVYITNINTRDWATHGYHISTGNKLGKGDLGWLKLNQLSGYASGKKDFLNDEVAWTQEGGLEEYIVRPSDGAILTPIAKKGSVLNAQASNNLWNMSNSPAEFIKENLGIGGASVPNTQNVNNTYTQHIDNVIFDFKNVKNYDQMLEQMQRDKNFENLVLSMSIDRIAGRSKLAKGKSIR